jgi:CubicO group peptidase (beta-lactamase class C family)
MSSSHRLLRTAVVVLLLCLSVPAVSAQTAPFNAGFDAYVENAMKTATLPGMAVGVVRDGKPIYMKGYGVRKLGEPTKVDAETIFQIGSTTKAFTAAALAILVDEGKVKWDGPVRDYMPTFQMYDPYVSKEITVRDLLTHRSGLSMGQGDLLFFPGTDLSSADLVRRMKFMQPKWSFRSHWAYCNLCYLAAGELIPAVTGQSWQDFVKTRIFVPLEMNASVDTMADFKRSTNAASPHSDASGKLQVVASDSVDSAAPAGAIVSSVTDMSKWIALQLAHGQLPDGKNRLFSEASAREMWSAASFLPIGPVDEPLLQRHFYEYGLGWFIWDYRGHRVVQHAGGVTGMVTQVMLVPDLNAGLVVLSNADANGASAVGAVMMRTLDSLIGAPEKDWTTYFNQRWEKAKAQAAEVEKQAAAKRDASRKPSLPLEGYTGTYHDDWFVDVNLKVENGHLVFEAPHAPLLTADLEPWQGDSFVATFRDSRVPKAYVYFALNPDSSIESLRMAAVSPLADFSYDFQDLLFKPIPKSTSKK